MRARDLGVVLFALALAPRAASAHASACGYVEIVERAPGEAEVRVRAPTPESRLRARFGEGCTEHARGPSEDAGSVRVVGVRCDGPLSGRTLVLEGLGPSAGDAVVLVDLASGASVSRVVTSRDPRLVLPTGVAGSAALVEYAGLGLRHIASGLDHLAFLLLLVLTLRRLGAVLVAETAFTISHALAFAATALGWVRVSAPAAEAAIALSLVLVALDVGRRDRPPPRDPEIWATALVFGVVHGLGFAGGLREIGLPEQHVAQAILGFGLGIEVGQVAFVLAAVAALAALERLTRGSRFVTPLAYALGIMATYWLFARTLSCFHLG